MPLFHTAIRPQNDRGTFLCKVFPPLLPISFDGMPTFYYFFGRDLRLGVSPDVLFDLVEKGRGEGGGEPLRGSFKGGHVPCIKFAKKSLSRVPDPSPSLNLHRFQPPVTFKYLLIIYNRIKGKRGGIVAVE